MKKKTITSYGVFYIYSTGVRREFIVEYNQTAIFVIYPDLVDLTCDILEECEKRFGSFNIQSAMLENESGVELKAVKTDIPFSRFTRSFLNDTLS